MKIYPKNMSSTNTLLLCYELNGKTIDMAISTLVTRHDNKHMNDPTLFLVTEKYLEHNGVNYQTKLFNLLSDFSMAASFNLSADDNGVNMDEKFLAIVNMLDLKDIETFILNTSYVKCPKNIKKTFDSMSNRYDKNQTYVESEYYELAAFVVWTQIMFGVFGEYILSSFNLRKGEERMSLYYRFQDIDAFNGNASIKNKLALTRYIDANTQHIPAFVARKLVSSEELLTYMSAMCVMTKFPVSNLYKADENDSAPTRCFNAANSALSKTNSAGKGSVKDKPQSNGSDEAKDAGAMSEVWATGEIPVGHIYEINTVMGNINWLVAFMKFDENQINIVNDALGFLKPMIEGKCIPSMGSVKIASYVTHKMVTCTASNNFEIIPVANMIAVAFTLLYTNGFQDIALLLVTAEYNNEDDAIIGNSRVRLPDSLMSEVKEHYTLKEEKKPRKKSHVVDDKSTPIDKSINLLVDLYENTGLYYLADKRYREGSTLVILPTNFRRRLLESLLFIIKRNKDVHYDRF